MVYTTVLLKKGTIVHRRGEVEQVAVMPPFPCKRTAVAVYIIESGRLKLDVSYSSFGPSYLFGAFLNFRLCTQVAVAVGHSVFMRSKHFRGKYVFELLG